MKRYLSLAAFVVLLASAFSEPEGARLMVRSRVHLFRSGDQWSEAHAEYRFNPKKSALIVCDMWDKHWCTGANVRVAALVKKMEPILEEVRRHGMVVVHAPSETMAFYAGAPQREAILKFPRVEPPAELNITAPPLPIDDSRGGCDTPGETQHKAWTCENQGLKIAPQDYISDNGQEIYNLLRARGVETIFYTGVHANMCILNRTFAIRQMTKWGMKCILLRDLTDAMYNPEDTPHVSHAQGTELVVEHIEKYWSPTALSSQLKDALR